MKGDLHFHLGGSYPRGDCGDYFGVFDTVLERGGDNFQKVVVIPGFEDENPTRFDLWREWVSERGRVADIDECSFFDRLRNLISVRGQEVFSSGGHHLLFLGVGEKPLEGGRHYTKILEDAKKRGYISVVAHPFGVGKFGHVLERDPGLIPFFDAYEVFNAQAGWIANERAKKSYERILFGVDRLAPIAVSDGNRSWEAFLGCTHFRNPSLGHSPLRTFKEKGAVPTLYEMLGQCRREIGVGTMERHHSLVGRGLHIADIAFHMLRRKT